MGKLNIHKKIKLNDKEYTISKLAYRGQEVPILLDSNIYDQIVELNKDWSISNNGFVYTTHNMIKDNSKISKDVYLHEVVMQLGGNASDRSILHINRLGIDNRQENLMYDTINKDITKNLKKKARTITLPKSTGIKSNNIPSYVWYLRECDTHGERFGTDIGGIHWKSKSSKGLSLKYKLEETKKYLRHMKNKLGSKFNDYSMNGDLNNNGKLLLSSFLNIAMEGGFKNINYDITGSNTDIYLKEDLTGLTVDEINLLNSVEFH